MINLVSKNPKVIEELSLALRANSARCFFTMSAPLNDEPFGAFLAAVVSLHYGGVMRILTKRCLEEPGASVA